MKKIYSTLLFSTLFVTSLIAQSFSVETLEQPSSGFASDFDIYETIGITNDLTNGDVVVLSWERILEDVPGGWETTICDPCVCHPVGVVSGTGCYLSSSNTNAYVNTHFIPNGVAGVGTVKVRLWDESTFDEVTVTFIGTAEADPLAVTEHETTFLRAFPNPFSESLNLEFNFRS